MRTNKSSNEVTDLAGLCEHFFVDWLKELREATPATIATYSSTFQLLLPYLAANAKKKIEDLGFRDLSPEVVQKFLVYLIEQRSNSRNTRNIRLAGIRSFAHSVILKEPKYMHQCQRLLEISSIKAPQSYVPYLNREQLDAILEAADRTTWVGERNFTLMLLAAQMGLRNTTLLSLRRSNILADWSAIRSKNKGGKELVTPLAKKACQQLQSWVKRLSPDPSALLFPDKSGRQLSPDSFQALTHKYKLIAQHNCVSLRDLRVTPHVFRHTCAMMLIESGCDIYTVSRWLGHESIDTTQKYLECNLAMKRKVLKNFSSQNVSPAKKPIFKPKILRFLQNISSPTAVFDREDSRRAI
jgi:integrase/recombinase XerD